MREMKMNQQHLSCKNKEKEQLYKIGMFANMKNVRLSVCSAGILLYSLPGA